MQWLENADAERDSHFSLPLYLSVSQVSPCAAPVFLDSSNGEHFTRPITLPCLLPLFFSSPPVPPPSLSLSWMSLTADSLKLTFKELLKCGEMYLYMI